MQHHISTLFNPRWIKSWTDFFHLSPCIPFYHVISDEKLEHINPLYPVRNIKQFIRDLDFFLQYFEACDLDTLISNPRGKKNGKSFFHLTFDDGLRQVCEIAQPILLQKGIPATLFINSNFLDNRELMFRYKCALIISRSEKLNKPPNKSVVLNLGHAEHEQIDQLAEELDIDFRRFLHSEKPYADSRQLEHWLDSGFTLGSHTKSHPWLQNLTESEVWAEIEQGHRELKEAHPRTADVFAFPFSDAYLKSDLFEKMQEAGFRASFGGSGIKRDLAFNFARFPMEKDQREAEQILATQYAMFPIKQLAGRARMKR